MSKKLSTISRREEKIISETLSNLFEQPSNQNTLKDFFEHILTKGERSTISRRLTIARLILAGKTYHEVNELLQVSPNTFRNIRQWLQSELPEYDKVITVAKQKSSTQKHEQIEAFTFKHLRKKYPMHFLLFTAFEELSKK